MKDKNQKLYNEAKKIIPNGTMLFSKNQKYTFRERPTYYSKAKKAYVWDLEKKRYLDMYFGVVEYSWLCKY